MVAQGCGTLGRMSSALISPDGTFEYEAAHGTATRHYRSQQKGEDTSTNSISANLAWTRSLERRGTIGHTPEIVEFAKKLEDAVIKTVAVDGKMAKDLALARGETDRSSYVLTEEFIDFVNARLQKSL